METANNEKTKSAQVSFKTSVENRLKMEDEARKLGLTMSEYIKLRLDQPQKLETREKPKDSKKEDQDILQETDGNSEVFLRSLSEKQDTTNDLLGQLIDVVSGKQPAELETISTEEEISEAIKKQEEELRANNLILKLSEKQRNVFFNLMMFKKENGGKYSDSPESFFFSILKEKYYDEWLSSVPPGFKKEFKEAFADFFNPPKEQEKENTPEAEENNWP